MMSRATMPHRTGRPPKLAPEIIDWIRRVYFGGFAKQAQLAKFFGVSQSTVHRIISSG